MTFIIFSVLLYLVGFPLLVYGFMLAYKELRVKRAMRKNQERKPERRKDPEALPQPLGPSFKEHRKFAFKDTRGFQYSKKKDPVGITNRMVMLMVYIVGFVVALTGGIMGSFPVVALSALFFYGALFFGLLKARPVIAKRHNIIERQAKIVEANGLGVKTKKHAPSDSVTVTQWIDLVVPSEVEIHIPDDFKDAGQTEFMRHWNQVFGIKRSWVAKIDQETGEGGWDYENNKLTIYAVPPLPQLAKWDEHYVVNPNVAWSFFPLGIGVENGLELTNPETNEVEHVIGIDVNGAQASLNKETGTKMSQTISAAPHILVGGGTGGGKAMSADTEIVVFNEKEVLHRIKRDITVESGERV